MSNCTIATATNPILFKLQKNQHKIYTKKSRPEVSSSEYQHEAPNLPQPRSIVNLKILQSSVPDRNTELKVRIIGENLPRNLPRHRRAVEIKG